MATNLPPGPSSFEIITALPRFFKSDVAYYEHFLKKFGDLVFMSLGEFEILLVNHPDAVKHVLKTNYTNFSRTRAIRELEPLLKDGIFYLEEEEWRRELAIIKPAFHQSVIDISESVLVSETQKALNLLLTQSTSGEPIELSSFLRNLFLTILIRTQCSPDASVDQKFMMHNLAVLLDGVRPGAFYKRVLKKELSKWIGKKNSEDAFKLAAQNIEEMMMKIFDDAATGKIESTGIMHILLNAYREGRINYETVKGEMRNIVFAGMDTIADSMTWFLNNLMLNPDIQSRCRQEIAEVSGETIIRYSEIDKFVFFSAALRESLRLNPAVWAIHRMSIVDEEIMGYTVPKGVWIFISPYFLHRNSNFWDDAFSFNPERFIGKNLENPFQYIPFGQGPHYCLGSRIAQLQILQITGSFLKQFEFKRASQKSETFYAGVMLHPAEGLYAHLKKIP